MDQDTLGRCLAEAKARFGAAPLRRLEEAFRATERDEGPPPSAPSLQRPNGLYVPGLTARPWHDPAQFPAATVLESAAGIIREELFQVLQQREGFQPLDEGPGGFQPYQTNFGWNVFYLRRFYRDLPGPQARCPGTAAALRALPDLSQLAYFSALVPGTHLEAHCGPSNAALTLHLGLSIPRECTIRVGQETRTWQEGKCLVFDDSFEHEVWNRGKQTRFVLLLEVWHPDLTEVEKRFLAWALPLATEAAEQAGEGNGVEPHCEDLRGKTWWE